MWCCHLVTGRRQAFQFEDGMATFSFALCSESLSHLPISLVAHPGTTAFCIHRIKIKGSILQSQLSLTLPVLLRKQHGAHVANLGQVVASCATQSILRDMLTGHYLIHQFQGLQSVPISTAHFCLTFLQSSYASGHHTCKDHSLAKNKN